MTTRTNIIFPVENETRELDSRLVLAGLHASANRRFFVGGTSSCNRAIAHIAPAVYFGKHIVGPTAANPTDYYEAKKHGLVLVHLSEEGGVFPGNEDDWRSWLDHQLRPSVLRSEDLLCVWGDFQADFYRSQGSPAEIRTTGHPRFDLCTQYRAYFAEEAAAIRRRFGDFVLFNTTFGFAVNAMGLSNTFSEFQGYYPDDAEKRMTLVRGWQRSARGVAALVALVHRLSILRPDIQFVIRPHPSEEIDFYTTVFNRVSNVSVVREGVANAWALASRVVVHDGSTTGLEAHLLGRPVVNFHEHSDNVLEMVVTDSVGRRCSTENEALEAILEALDKGTISNCSEPSSRAHGLLYNLGHDDSTKLIVRALSDAEKRMPRESPAPNLAKITAAEWRAFAIEESKNVVRPLWRHRYLSARERRWNVVRFNEAKVDGLLERVRRVTGTKFEYRIHGRHLLELWSDRPAPSIE